VAAVREHYDCVIVGSGASGATLAYALARKGVDVLLVERGDYLKPPSSHDAADPRIGFPQSAYPSSLACVGGPTKFYGSALYRLREMDFQSTRLETGESPAWPITYRELEPYYCAAESLYAVHGSPAGDPTEPSRSAPYPFPPLPHAKPIRELVDRIEANGVPVAAIPRGLDYRDGGKCVLCSTCDGYYCRLDAKMDAEIACVRPALATGHVELLTNTECLRVLVAPGHDRATGVVLRRGSVESTIEAGHVVVSAGLLESPLLLRRSKTSKSPAGLGNDYGCLGRYNCGHTVDMVLLVLGLAPIAGMHSKTFAINAFYGPDAKWPYPQGVIQMAGQLPVEDQPAHVRAVMARSLVCLCMTEEPAVRDAGIRFVGDGMAPEIVRPPLCKKSLDRLVDHAKKIFRQAGCSFVMKAPGRNVGWHGVGTARMGTDPRTSVVDPQCRVHGFENLYVVDASALVTPGAVNTGLTLMAMALRAADTIAPRAAS
jgi:choline dehydrogenase-like flavoprotein